MEKEFFVHGIDAVNHNNRTIIRLFGRDNNRKKIVCFDTEFKPYFYVRFSNKTSITRWLKSEDNEYEILKKKIMGEEINVCKIFTNTEADIPKIRTKLKKKSFYIESFEHDVRLESKYIINKKFKPFEKVTIKGDLMDSDYDCDEIYSIESIKPLGEFVDDLKIMAFDIEVYPGSNFLTGKSPIISISHYMNKKGKGFSYVKSAKGVKCKDEADMLEKFFDSVKKEDPDVIVGYNSDSFDFNIIKRRLAENEMTASLNWDNSPMFHSRSKNERMFGIVNIDLFSFVRHIIRPILKTDRLDLDSVSRELINDGKKEISLDAMKDYKKNMDKILEYNIHDSVLTYKLAKEFEPIIMEISKLSGRFLFDSSRSTSSQLVEGMLMLEVQDFNELIPEIPHGDILMGRLGRTYAGSFVFEPKKGLYERVAVLDFKSFWPSIIVDYNICPSTIGKGKKHYKTPKIDGVVYKFAKDYKGFVPVTLKKLLVTRSKLKNAKKIENRILNAKQYALKLFANSVYGYLAYTRSRWYSVDCAQSATGIGRDYIAKAIEGAEKNGFKVIYADNDSLFLFLGKKKVEDVKKFKDDINKKLPATMNLEYEDLYKKALFVSKRKGKTGAKKKYVLVDNKNKLDIKGFQYVRRDWSLIARETQYKVMKKILIENNVEGAVKYLKKIIKEVNEHKTNPEKLIISNVLKRSLETYKQKGPHVVVALRLQEKGKKMLTGQIIEYIVTDGKGSISQRARTPEEFKKDKLKYDSKYYTQNQIIPVVEEIFDVFGYDTEDLQLEKQEGLSKWMKK